MRIGHGYDAHRLVAGRPLWLGGVDVPHARGLAGHSDGDVLLHAVASALLGALGEGDLGRHFPSSDPALAGIASGELLARVAARMRAAGLALAHLDSTMLGLTVALAIAWSEAPWRPRPQVRSAKPAAARRGSGSLGLSKNPT